MSRVFYVLSFACTHLLAQSNKDIYSKLLENNRSLYDIKDSTLYFDCYLYNRFKFDTLNFKKCYLLKSNNPKTQEYEISTIYWINKIENSKYVSYSKKWNNIDSPTYLKKYNLDKGRPNSIFYPFDVLPKVRNGGFDKKIYCNTSIQLYNDTFVLTQDYKKLKRKRKLYFKGDYKIFKIEKFNYNTEESDEYFCVNISYFPSNRFDSINYAHKLGFYTPIIKDSIKTIIKLIDTLSKSSKQIHILGDDSVLSVSKNKYILLDYWYLSCSPCLKMMPFMSRLHTLIDTNKIIIIGVNESDKEMNITKYLESKGYHFIQIDANKNIMPFDIIEFPTLILVDSDFNEIYRFKGYNSKFSDDLILKYLKSLGLLSN